jgi:trehalose utilization protein
VWARSRLADARLYPLHEVGHNDLSVEIAKQIVDVPIVKLQRLVERAGAVVEHPTAFWLRRLAGAAVKNKQRQRDEREFVLSLNRR